MKYKQEEKQECKKLAYWLRFMDFKFTHIANERKVPIYVGAEFKALGVSKGFPDYFIFIDRDRCTSGKDAGLFIEMKKNRKILASGKESKENLVGKEQLEWLSVLGKIDNIESAVCYGFEEAVEFIKQYLKDT